MVLYSNGQSSSPIHSDQEVTRLDQGQNLQNHVEKQEEYWVISIKKDLEQTREEVATTNWNELCIYRVPQYLQENDNKSYFPQTVSIGPYHHGKEHLLHMEYHKRRAAIKVIGRYNEPDIEIYLYAMKYLEKKARACYEGPIDMSSNKFVEMLVFDGCFVLELLEGTDKDFSQIGYALNDPVFSMGGLMVLIQRDMVMLENQLPMFVLDCLYNQRFLKKEKRSGTLAKAALEFFKPLMPTSQIKETIDWNETLEGNGELHCLDVFHRSLIRTFHADHTPNCKTGRYILSRNESKVDNGQQQQQLIHCVTELREAGVKFRSKQIDKLWDIKFNNGYLEIPKILIDDSTKSLFSNLIAFEQCHHDSSDIITSYLIFMDNLINSSNDVSYLHHCGIIEHWLGSDSEVADLFNRLGKGVVFNPNFSYLSQLSDDVNRYHSRKWNSFKATLRHRYFSNPWAYLSFLAAIALLILTFTQTFYAVYAYYKPFS